MRYLRFLSKTYGILPPSFILHTVVRDGSDAVCGGGFAVGLHSTFRQIDLM